ncbi:MAG: hypothetical protein ABSC01_10640 [Verrucomicrobiota bacterium]|jgi:hypothetical protein
MPPLPPTHRQRLDAVEQHSSATATVASSSAEALRQLMHGHMPRVVCHSVALVIEFIGTVFIFLDALRLDAQLRSADTFAYDGNPPIAYRHWYYQSAELGFALLLLGILAQGYLLWIENGAIRRAAKALAQAGRVSPP